MPLSSKLKTCHSWQALPSSLGAEQGSCARAAATCPGVSLQSFVSARLRQLLPWLLDSLSNCRLRATKGRHRTRVTSYDFTTLLPANVPCIAYDLYVERGRRRVRSNISAQEEALQEVDSGQKSSRAFLRQIFILLDLRDSEDVVLRKLFLVCRLRCR
jgi:hypothetical protein